MKPEYKKAKVSLIPFVCVMLLLIGTLFPLYTYTDSLPLQSSFSLPQCCVLLFIHKRWDLQFNVVSELQFYVILENFARRLLRGRHRRKLFKNFFYWRCLAGDFHLGLKVSEANMLPTRTRLLLWILLYYRGIFRSCVNEFYIF